MNKEVMRHVRAIVFDSRIQSKWSIAVPLAQRIINTSVHATTGVSPAQLIFGNAVDLD